MKKLSKLVGMGFFLGMWMGVVPAQSDEIVYTPINPNFGGSPFNGAPLLNNAISQNKHKESTDNSALASALSSGNSFQSQLNRAFLSRLSRDLVDNAFGGLDSGIQFGTFNTGVNTVTIEDLGTSVKVTITDNSSGEVTVVEIDNVVQ
ncbi:MAG: curli assembly protein CsgF [Nitrospinaceae bacterium]